MLRALRWIATLSGGLLLLGLFAGLVFAASALLRIRGYHPPEDAAALARKRSYLAEIASRAGSLPKGRPNLVVILFDDLGDGDLGFMGSRAVATPRIDRLAREGAVLDHYYAPAPYCTPSRAGLLTGRYPIRTGLTQVVFPKGSPIDSLERWSGRPVGLPAEEITLAEVLHAAGYATAMVGKWHLGDASPSLPNDLGFEHYLGVLYSNDMQPLALWRNRKIVAAAPVDQTTLTARYTEEAIRFIRDVGSQPFFLYFAHSFPHIPLHASQANAGRSDAGLYGDVVADLDDSVGAVLDALAAQGHSRDTLVIVTSDNGPWFQGSARGNRGRKNDTFEGGMRVPFAARWPGRIPPGTRSSELAIGMDVFSTGLALARVPPPEDRRIDGRDLLPLLADGASSAHDTLYYYSDRDLQALRSRRFKLHDRHGVFGGAPWSWPIAPLMPRGPWLFDLQQDPDESYDVHARYPERFTELQARMAAWERALAANPRGWR